MGPFFSASGASYPGYHLGRKTFSWATYENVLGEFGPDAKKARAAYRQFVSATVGQEPASSRAVAAYLARRCFGYRSKDVASELGYASAGGVGQVIARVEAADLRCRRTVQRLATRLANG